jgi:hypothetical protein
MICRILLCFVLFLPSLPAFAQPNEPGFIRIAIFPNTSFNYFFVARRVSRTPLQYIVEVQGDPQSYLFPFPDTYGQPLKIRFAQFGQSGDPNYAVHNQNGGLHRPYGGTYYLAFGGYDWGEAKYLVTLPPGTEYAGLGTLRMNNGSVEWAERFLYQESYSFFPEDYASDSLCIAASCGATLGMLQCYDSNRNVIPCTGESCPPNSNLVGGICVPDGGGGGGGLGEFCACIAEGIGDKLNDFKTGLVQIMKDAFIPSQAKANEMLSSIAVLRDNWGPTTFMREIRDIRTHVQAQPGATGWKGMIPVINGVPPPPPNPNDPVDPTKMVLPYNIAKVSEVEMDYRFWTRHEAWGVIRGAMGVFIYLAFAFAVRRHFTPKMGT